MHQFSVPQEQLATNICTLTSIGKKIYSEMNSGILLGICAMKNKVESKPMKELLSRLNSKDIKVILMNDYLQTAYEVWPRVNALICFYSKGFPYLKAWNYIKKYDPFLINSYQKQQLLWDRSVVCYLLKKLRIPTPDFFSFYRNPNQIDKIQRESFGDLTPTKEKNQNYNLNSHQQSIKQKNEIKIQLEALQRINLKNKMNLEKPKQQIINDRSINKLEKDFTLIGCQKQDLSQNYKAIDNEKFPNILRKMYKIIHCNNQQLQTTEIYQNDEEVIIHNQKISHHFKKPFVEKPFDALNHQICIYYPETMGGGRKRIFQKMKNQSSIFEPQNAIRKDTNYIYQNFIPQNGFIIKVYTVGVSYMYAEARKSPALDGVVIRNKQGKEVRYSIILTPEEKDICKKIVIQFEQDICGIKIIRSQKGKSYVLSVNGWSLAKNNTKYWDDCAYLLKRKLYSHFFPHSIQFSKELIRYRQVENNYRPPINTGHAKVQELRSIVIICRHADRSPKEKLKIKTKQKRFIQLFSGCRADVNQIKYRDSKNLKKILGITNQILKSIPGGSAEVRQFTQMKKALESGGQLQGLTHKIQMKVNERDEKGNIKKIVIVLKWGGELSSTGYKDAIELGKLIRNERYKDDDLLSLYSSYQHDLKTYSSEQGRCIKTAAAFVKGFLNLEGELAPIITSMVTVDQKAQRLLDCTPQQNHSKLLQTIQGQLTTILNSEEQLSQSIMKFCNKSEMSQAMRKNIAEIGCPRRKIQILYKLIQQLAADIQNIEKTTWEMNSLHEKMGSHQTLQDEHQCEDILLVKERWNKLVTDFFDKQTNLFNVSKLAEIYDTAKHDQRKNKIIFNLIDQSLRYELKKISKKLTYFMISNELGFTDDQKILNAKNICTPLLQKVLEDMSFWKVKSPREEFWRYTTCQEDSWKHLRTRLYFTSASHLYSLLHLFTLGSKRKLLEDTNQEYMRKISDILYMGQYQNLTVSEESYCRFRIEISICYQFHRNKPIQKFKLGGKNMYIQNVQEFLRVFIEDFRKKVKQTVIIEGKQDQIGQK